MTEQKYTHDFLGHFVAYVSLTIVTLALNLVKRDNSFEGLVLSAFFPKV